MPALSGDEDIQLDRHASGGDAAGDVEHVGGDHPIDSKRSASSRVRFFDLTPLRADAPVRAGLLIRHAEPASSTEVGLFFRVLDSLDRRRR
jgi:hypothetical protein